MSTISSIIGQDLSQYYQSITGTSPTTASQTAGSTSATTTTTPQPVQGHHHHHHGGQQNSLFNQIASGVTNALQGAGPSTDPNTTIQNAIEKVLKSLQSSSSTGATSTTSSSSASDPDGDGDPTTGATGPNGKSKQSAFLQALQSAGVTPQQFRQDFLNAIQNVNGNGQSGTSQSPINISQFLPPGSILDAAA